VNWFKESKHHDIDEITTQIILYGSPPMTDESWAFGKITKIKLSDSGKDDHFRILVEVEKSEK